jgi:hypothetical protein
MKGFHAILLIAFLVSSCNPLERSDRSPEEAIPEDAVFILKVGDPAAASRELLQAEKTPDVESTPNIFSMLQALRDLRIEDPGYLVALSSQGDSLSYLYISKIPDTLSLKDSLTVDSTMTKGATRPATEPLSDEYKPIVAEIGNLRFTSRDASLIDRQKNASEDKVSPAKRLALGTKPGADKPFTLFVDAGKTDSLSWQQEKGKGTKWTDLAGSFALDLNLGPDKLQWTGVGFATDSLPSLLSLFEHTQPVVQTLAALTPADADGLLSISFSDHPVYAANQVKQYPQTRAYDSLFRTTEEVGFVFKDNNSAVIINTYGALKLSEYLQQNRLSTYDYQGKEVGVVEPDALFEKAFPPFVRDFEFTHYAALDNAFVFSGDQGFLERIIRDVNSGNTFDKSAIYLNARPELAEASSLLLLAEKNKSAKITSGLIPPALLSYSEVKNGSDLVFAFQVVADRSFSHLNTFVKSKKNLEKKMGVSPRFTVQLSAPLATNPQFVKDHRNDTQEIVVQDTENNLYLISTDGKILWKKKLEGRVQGRIEQIDLYKNGRLQLAFTTSNQFLVLDRNGKEVAPFDMKFSGPILNPLAVFDYEGNRNYRFVVTQGKDVRMYNGKGQIVSGFKYAEAESAVLDRPRHFRVGTRDYLVFKLEDGSLKILNRVGDTRVKVNEQIDFSENDIYSYNDKFIVTDKTGTLFSVDTQGKIAKTRFNLSADHGMDATVKTLSLMNDNELTIKGNKASLDLGVYTKPRIFYIYDKIYVSVTDIQSQKAYLFDSNAIPFRNFPVYAASVIDLSDMDNDRKVDIAAKFEENSLIVYSLN